VWSCGEFFPLGKMPVDHESTSPESDTTPVAANTSDSDEQIVADATPRSEEGSAAEIAGLVESTAKAFFDAARRTAASVDSVLGSARKGNDEIANLNRDLSARLAAIDVRQATW
jgi:hypothetical protein